MNKVNFVILVLVVALAAFVALFLVRETRNVAPPPASEESVATTTEAATATFAWRFAEADTLNPDGLPQTNVFLTITRNGESQERRIDTVDGSCSELEGEKYEGDISDTGNVQCYAAGLGQRYRITQNDRAYLVERKLFEEALPDVSPPEYEWEVIQEFSA